MIRTCRSNLRLFASSSDAGERVTLVAVGLLTTTGAALLVTLLDKLFVVLLVMLPVALLRGLFVRLLLTLLMMLTVPLLFTWPSAPMSRSANPTKISRDENRLGKYCISHAPLCKEIVSRKGECIMTRAVRIE
jgi:hypothetical protein